MPDISIIVPIYKAGKYIRTCLESLINQTKKELEFILVNDGSPDKEGLIIEEYKDKRIKYYNNKHQGLGKTRNYGIEKSTGKYIMFLDSDDCLELNACELLYNYITSANLDVVVFDTTKKYSSICISFKKIICVYYTLIFFLNQYFYHIFLILQYYFSSF